MKNPSNSAPELREVQPLYGMTPFAKREKNDRLWPIRRTAIRFSPLPAPSGATGICAFLPLRRDIAEGSESALETLLIGLPSACFEPLVGRCSVSLHRLPKPKPSPS
jgi:hypothetical protein